MISLAIVVVAFENEEYLEQCLGSLRRSRFRDFIVVLVDNSLREGVGKRYAGEEGVYFLRSGENRGYCDGNNAGIAKAKELGAEYVFLLNHDAVVEPDCISRLMEEARRLPDLGAISPKILLMPNGKRIWYAGGHFNAWMGISVHHGFMQEDKEENGGAREIGFVPGTSLLVPMSIFDRFGTFNPVNFMYFEDTELCLRLRAHGVRLYYHPHAKVLHHAGAGTTLNTRPDYSLYFSIRNRPLVSSRYPYHLYLRLLATALAAVKVLLFSVLPGVTSRSAKLRAICWGWWDSFSTSPRYRKRFPRLFSPPNPS